VSMCTQVSKDDGAWGGSKRDEPNLPCIVLAVCVKPGEAADEGIADALKGEPSLGTTVNRKLDECGQRCERFLPIGRICDRPEVDGDSRREAELAAEIGRRFALVRLRLAIRACALPLPRFSR
jgi:hypothetical protein